MTTDTWTEPLDEPELPAARFDRPSAAQAERVIAASVMARPDLIDTLVDRFDPVDFSEQRLAWVWHAVDEIRHNVPDGPVGWIAVNQQLQRWRAEGYMPITPMDAVHLSALYDEASPAMAAWHADLVAGKAEGARLVTAMIDGIQRGNSETFDAAIDLPIIQANLDNVVRGESGTAATLIRDLYADAMKAAVTPPAKEDRIPTGLADMDALLGGGFTPGQFVIVGARPGVGKTTLGNNLARAAAIRHQLGTLFVSLEMGRAELMACILAAEARVPLHHINHGTVDPDHARRLGYLQERIENAPLYIDDATTVSLATLRGQVRHLVRTAGLRLLVVDYLQLMQVPRAENRQVAVSALSRGLKLMAKEFGIVVVALCQLNRGSAQRTDKRPTKDDLRESGSLEQDANIVVLLHREDMHEPDSARAGEIELIVDKNRSGPRTTITCAYQGHYARVIDMGGFDTGAA